MRRSCVILIASAISGNATFAQMRSDEGWAVVSNSAGAYADLPRSVFPKPVEPSARSRAIAYSTNDGRARFELFSSPNYRRESPAQFARRNGTDRDHLDYKRITNNFVAASAVANGTILYRRCNFSGSMIHCLDLRYPANEKSAWDQIVTRSSLSLRPR
jgi:hypothetical protein